MYKRGIEVLGFDFDWSSLVNLAAEGTKTGIKYKEDKDKSEAEAKKAGVGLWDKCDTKI